MAQQSQTRSTRLVCPDERGAIMVIAVFMAVFLVGILYYAIGIGRAVLLREHLQDSADASALSGAIMHARGMNFIVLVNLVMAALLAVLVTIKALEGLAILGIVVASALAWITGGSSLAAVPPLKALQQSMNSSYDAVKPPIFEALQVLHDTADTVRDIVPGATEEVALAESGAHGVPSAHGYFWPPRSDLPVQDDGFDTLCGKAGIDATHLVLTPLHKATGFDLGLDKPAADFTTALSSWFCGDSSDPPPAAKQEHVKTTFPQTQKDQACKDDTTPASPGDPNATTPACDASRAEAAAGAPDGATGACPASGDCGANGAYELLAATALDQCDPEGNPRPTKYMYQERKVKVSYQWTRAGWKRLEPQYLSSSLESVDRPPCGPKQVQPSVAVGYNRNVHPHGDVHEVVPVCTGEVPPAAPSRAPSFGTTVDVSFVDVVHILGCIKYLDESAQVTGISSAKDDGGNAKAPKMILPDATLGDANFQIRTLVTAAPPPDDSERILRVSLWNAGEPTNELAAEAALGELGVAQAEYFYDASDGRGEWMWNMNWRARLTRFRIPHGDGVMDGCTGACGVLVSRFGKYEPLFVH